MLHEPGCHLSANDSAQVECNNRAVVTVNDTVYETEGSLYLRLSIAFTLLYFTLIEGLTGATAGKHMTGLHVVTPEGNRLRALAGALGRCTRSTARSRSSSAGSSRRRCRPATADSATWPRAPT